MSHVYTNPSHRVFIIDLEQQLTALQLVVADYCDEYDLVNELSLLLMTVSLLYVRDSENESIEAMEIHINSFCRYEHNVFNTMRLRSAISTYMREVHDLFVQAGMYEDGPYLAYAFAGWHTDFTAIFAATSHIHEYPKARSPLVHFEPHSRNPLHIFKEVYDPDAAMRIYNAGLRKEDIIPF